MHPENTAVGRLAAENVDLRTQLAQAEQERAHWESRGDAILFEAVTAQVDLAASRANPDGRSVKGPDEAGRDALACWFGLSYANYLTLPRSLMEQMPDEWQGRMAGLLAEISYEFTWPVEKDVTVEVRLRRRCGKQYVDDPLSEYRRPNTAAIDAARKP